MDKLIPFFEVNGERYEIKLNRFLMVEFDKLKKEGSAEDTANVLKGKKLAEELEKFAKMLEDAEKTYLETFDKKDKAKYKGIKELYDEAFDNFTQFEAESGILTNSTKEFIDILEKFVIIALQELYNLNKTQATQVWCDYVDTIGKDKAPEWLYAMYSCLFEVDNKEQQEDKNDFLSQLRARNKKK